MSELRVGTRELKTKLDEYLQRVKAGETIFVTEHGKMIGKIVPVKQTVEERIQVMIASGLAEWSGKKPKPYKPVAENSGENQISDLVVEERE